MSKLLARWRRDDLEAEHNELVRKAVRESSASERLDDRARHERTKPGDARRLRGIPVQAPGVGGTCPGTDPLAELLAKEQRRLASSA